MTYELDDEELDDEHRKAHARALEAAASFLEGTAADYDQMAKQLSQLLAPWAGAGTHRAGSKTMEEKAALLRGQAQRVRLIPWKRAV